jgi:hypothetical protein
MHERVHREQQAKTAAGDHRGTGSGIRSKLWRLLNKNHGVAWLVS